MRALFGSMLSLYHFFIILGGVLPIILFEFGTIRIEEYVGSYILNKKQRSLYDFFMKRRVELDENMRILLDKVQFNCGIEDRRLLELLNRSNDVISVYGISTTEGKSCSNIGDSLFSGLGDNKSGLVYSINGERVTLSEVSEGDTLIRISKAQGELFWLIRSAKLNPLLFTSCKDCYSLNGFFPWFQAGFNLGNRDILSESEIRDITVLQDKSPMKIVLSVGADFKNHVKEISLWVMFFLIFLYYTCYLSILFICFLRRTSLQGKIKSALLRADFIPFYQPILDVSTHTLVGAEALVRWRKNDGVFISPANFLESLEGSELMLDMTSQLFRQVVKDMDNLTADIWVSVNICSEFLESGALYDILKELGWPYQQRLCFELTERLPIYNIENAKQQIEKLNKKGYHFKIDDFGSGYGGFAYLNEFHIQHIKIDKMFIDAIGGCARQESIVDGIILSAQRCNLQVIAEGVENITQSAYLMERGVVLQQGYLFYKPIPFDAFSLLCEAPVMNK